MEKVFELFKETRHTGMGAFDDTRLYSLVQQKELPPHGASCSRTGRHGSKTWYLLPGRYFMATISKSNSGRGGAWAGFLVIAETEEGPKAHREDGAPPDWVTATTSSLGSGKGFYPTLLILSGTPELRFGSPFFCILYLTLIFLVSILRPALLWL